MIGVTLFWLIPLLPLATFAALALGLSRTGRLAPWLAIGTLVGSSVAAILALVAAAGGARSVVALPWLTVGGRALTLALGLDPLSALVAALVSIVALLVFSYAATYMADDPRIGRFFTIFSLFAGAMLTLVLAADLITLFIAWELVGLCSYFLIGFWYDRPGVPGAASKAFLTTRTADQALLAGVLLLVGAAGTGRIDHVLAAVAAARISPGWLLLIALLLFAGAAGKSAQVPFQGWLPDAMAGPTPVSALLHSATMVAAGVFLVARLYPLFEAAEPALWVVAWIGAITALLGAIVALVQTDLKRLLAYSTMSQLGLMFVGLGSGSLIAGVLLLFAQALYKSTLFLAAGAVGHAVEGTGFERMGGLMRRMPVTFAAFAVAAAALAGLPVTLAAPAKDPVLAAASAANGALFVVALLASVGTALYSARALGLVFLGPSTGPAREAHEVGRGYLAPMVVLIGLIVVGLLADSPIVGRPLPELFRAEAPESTLVTILAIGIAVVGVAVGLWARRVWSDTIVWPVLRPVAPLIASEFGLIPLYRGIQRSVLAFANGLGAFDRHVFDPIGEWATRGTLRTIAALSTVDQRVFDAAATGIAKATLAIIRAALNFDLRRVDAAFTNFGRGLLAISQRLRGIQTGRIENYLVAVFVWGLGALVLAVIAAALR